MMNLVLMMVVMRVQMMIFDNDDGGYVGGQQVVQCQVELTISLERAAHHLVLGLYLVVWGRSGVVWSGGGGGCVGGGWLRK